MAPPATETPEMQIYFTTHRSGAFPVLRLRTVVRGERASRSIVNRTTALWSIWMVSSLMLANLESGRVYMKTWGRGDDESCRSNGPPSIAHSRRGGSDCIYRQQTGKNEHKIGSCLVEFFSRPPSAGRRLRFRPVWMKTGLELI